MKFGNIIPPSAIEHLPQDLTGPKVDRDFWNNHVAPAAMGPIEQGAIQQIAALRSIPLRYRVR